MNKNKITQFINDSQFSKFHIILVALGLFLITFTGYGSVAYGSVIPLLFGEWEGLNADVLGYIGSLSEFGSLFGALLFSSLSNKLGVKKVLITAAMIYSICTFGQSLAPSIAVFAALRFGAGFGFGGVIPLVISLLSEYSPKNSKSKSVAAALVGNQVGAIIASLVAIAVTSQLQWRPVFWMALVPIVLLPVIIALVPESALYLIKKKDAEGLKKVLKRIDENYASKIDVEAALNENTETIQTEKEVSYLHLFSKDYIVVSILACVIAAMGLLFINGVIVWLPNLMVQAGFKLGSSIAFTIFLCGGTIAGSILWAAVADKKGFRMLLPTIYTLGAVSLILMGIKSNIVVLYLFVTLVGFFLFAAHSLVNAFIAQHYPDELRNLAIGLPNSIGRVGGLLGPTLGGFLLANNVSLMGWFIVFAGAGLIAAVSFVIINLVTKKQPVVSADKGTAGN